MIPPGENHIQADAEQARTSNLNIPFILLGDGVAQEATYEDAVNDFYLDNSGDLVEAKDGSMERPEDIGLTVREIPKSTLTASPDA